MPYIVPDRSHVQSGDSDRRHILVELREPLPIRHLGTYPDHMSAVGKHSASLLQGECRATAASLDGQVHTTRHRLHGVGLGAAVLEECGTAIDKRRALTGRIMAEDAILDADTDRIPRRALPPYDEQPDDVGVIEGMMASGGPFKVAFHDTNQFGPHAMILMLFGFAGITGAILFALSKL